MTMIFYDSKLAKCILFGSFQTIMLFGCIFTKNKTLSLCSQRHETIHVRQYFETLIVGALVFGLLGYLLSLWLWLIIPFTYYAVYLAEWAISCLFHIVKGDVRNTWNDRAYHASAFEMEAYGNEDNPYYLKGRKLFAFVKYYGKL